MKMLWLVALCILPAVASSQVSAGAKDQVDRFLEAALRQMRIPGLTVAVVKDGELGTFRVTGTQSASQT
jgi:CubicO group peptidase (beta-lactamase class C family)